MNNTSTFLAYTHYKRDATKSSGLVESSFINNILKYQKLNVIGIMDLSNDETACFLAFPGSNTTGHVHIYDAEDLKAICQISAHSGPLACLKLEI